MPVTEYASIDSVSVGGTELSVISGTTSLQSKTDHGIYGLMIDPVEAALAKGDYFQVAIYEKVLSGGTQRKVFSTIVGNAQAEPWIIPPLMLRHGWDMTLKKVAGTDRSWDASVRGVAGSIVEAYTLSAVTVGASELSITNGDTTLQTKAEAGIYQLFVDLTNMAKGDEYAIRVYEKTKTTKRQLYKQVVTDASSIANWVSPVLCLINGWEMTLQKISGTDRAFSASIRKIA